MSTSPTSADRLSRPPGNGRVTVIIATFNRARILRQTLEAMCQVERTGLQVQWVVVDNHSTDETPAVIDSFADRLPLKHLHEPKAGKNCALNRALAEPDLGDILVFTDDDVTPDPNWLHAIVGACERWPEHTVFGGRITIAWPDDGPPAWAPSKRIQTFAFCLHEHETAEGLYPQGQLPFGANLWVRRSVFAGPTRYREDVGPHPENRIMGSETTFLLDLARAGTGMIYVPSALIHHRVTASQCTFESLHRRAITYGRGRVHFGAMPSPNLLQRSHLLWVLRQWSTLATAPLLCRLSALFLGAERRALFCLKNCSRYGMAREGLQAYFNGRH